MGWNGRSQRSTHAGYSAPTVILFWGGRGSSSANQLLSDFVRFARRRAAPHFCSPAWTAAPCRNINSKKRNPIGFMAPAVILASRKGVIGKRWASQALNQCYEITLAADKLLHTDQTEKARSHSRPGLFRVSSSDNSGRLRHQRLALDQLRPDQIVAAATQAAQRAVEVDAG